MASKKKIASDLVAQRWYRTLPPKWKSLYIHLVCVANVAGIFEVDCDSFAFHIKCDSVSADDVFSVFGNRVQRVKGHPDKGIIVGYIAFQHSFPRSSQQWQWVAKELEKVGLTIEDVERMSAKEGEQMMLPIPEPKREKQQRNIIPPKVDWVREYCSTRNNSVDAEQFCDFYSAKGWKVGNQKMKDWQAAVRTWEKESRKPTGATGASAPVVQSVGDCVIRKVF